ncbi:YqgE/AlgH family protein [Gemmobacter lanyuensis]
MDLSGSILISMPGMGDPRFERTVILICAHSPEGAMGLIINKPAPDLDFSALLDHLDIPRGLAGRDIRVHLGGPSNGAAASCCIRRIMQAMAAPWMWLAFMA